MLAGCVDGVGVAFLSFAAGAFLTITVSLLLLLTVLPFVVFGPEPAEAADFGRLLAAPAGFVCGTTFRPALVGGREFGADFGADFAGGAGLTGEEGKVRELADLGESICFGSMLTREVVRSGKIGAAF